ncbi:hypothetical protein TNCV_4869571 [Trichonephila clavipes]|nr:hypothetical protein TNCV_4869571 [Trichonephila clavipes]
MSLSGEQSEARPQASLVLIYRPTAEGMKGLVHLAQAGNRTRMWCGMQGFNLKNRKDISYPTIIRSAIRPVPHGPDLPIPSPPDTLDNILDNLDQISHISSDSDDGYDPGTNDPELFS